MFRKTLFILIIFSAGLQAAPLKTVIHGRVKGASEKWIRMYSYTNLITQKPVKITQDSVGKNELFRFEFNLQPNEIKTVFFAVERFRSFDFYVEAGKTYELNFDSLDYNIQDEYYSPLTSEFPNLIFLLSADSAELNQLILQLTMELINFSIKDFADVVGTRNISKMEGFKTRLDSIFAGKGNEFLKAMVEYSYAEMEFTARLKNNAYFVRKYFSDRPFLYDHPAFMYFFNVFFDKYIYATSRKISIRDLDLHIIRDRNYKALLDSLGKDTLLKNEVVRDMVLIKNLSQMYFSGFYPRDSVYLLMKDISLQSKFKRHRAIAASILSEMTLHQKEKAMPSLKVRELDGDPVCIDTMKGKYIYLMFFTTYCTACYPEFAVLEDLVKKYKNNIHFITVSMDVSFLKFYYFMQDYQYSWDFYNFSKNFEIEEQWGVQVYPHAFMINPEGNIINSNAPMPSEFLDNYLGELLKLSSQKGTSIN